MQSKTFIVGLTGGIGSGKSTVAKAFSDLGVEAIDADVIAREVVVPGTDALKEIAAHFGNQILNTDGNLRRDALRKIVFDNPAEKDWLEKLLHPLIRKTIEQQIANVHSEYCLLVSPLLLETDQRELVDRILVVDITPELQLERTIDRDGSDKTTIEAIIAAQINRESRLQAADDILDNQGGLDTLQQAVDELHMQYLKLARSP